MDYIEVENFCSKVSSESENTIHRVEKVFAIGINKGLVSGIRKELLQINKKRADNSIENKTGKKKGQNAISNSQYDVKRCPASPPIIREIQIKTAMRYLYKAARKPSMRSTTGPDCEACRAAGNLGPCR